MTNDEFDERLSTATRPLVTTIVSPRVASDAAGIHSEPSRQSAGAMIGVGIATLIVLAAVFRLASANTGSADGRGPRPSVAAVEVGQTASPSPDVSAGNGADLLVDGVKLSVTETGGLVTLSATAPQEPSRVVAQVPADASTVDVFQAVCPASDVVGRHVVLFGKAPGNGDAVLGLTINGLDPARIATGGDGTFLFISDGVPNRLHVWTASLPGYQAIHSTVAVYGTRLILRSPGASSPPQSCVVFDPRVQKAPVTPP